MAERDPLETFTKLLHALVTLMSMAITFTLMAITLGADKDHAQFFVTNSFLSTYRSDTPLVSYTPLSDKLNFNEVRETYLNCLMEARVGLSDLYKCPENSSESYRTCLTGLYTADRRVTKMVQEIRKIIASYGGQNVTEVAQLPGMLTNVNQESTLRANLLGNDARNALKLRLNMQSTSASVLILDAIARAERSNGIDGCVTSAQNMLPSGNSPVYDVAPIFAYLWQCTSDLIVTEPIQKVGFEKCVPFDMWPAKDVMQTPYTLNLFGCYNPYFLLIIATWLMTSFAVYTFPGLPSKATSNGKPAALMARAGLFLVGLGFAWNALGANILILVRGFSPGDKWENFPMSIQTVFLSLFFSVTATIYFGKELYQLYVLKGTSTDPIRGTPQQASSQMVYANGITQQSKARLMQNKRYHSLASFMHVTGATTEEVSEQQYTPLVVPVWADAWVFVDSLFFLGVLGLSKDVVTADVVIVTLCVFLASLINSGMVRLLYDGYIEEGREAPRSKDQTTLQSIRVMAVVANIAAILLASMAIWILAKRFGGERPLVYILLSFFLPQLAWLLVTLVLDFTPRMGAYEFFHTASIIFSYQVALRFVFVIIAVQNRNILYDATVGDGDSLNNLLRYMNTPK
jgi:hypothetical protein